MKITGLTVKNGRLVETRRNKYNANCDDAELAAALGVKDVGGFDSAGERDYAAQLEIQLRAGILTSVERQVTFPLEVNGKLICKHRVDFLIEHRDGRREVIEYKGVGTDVWRIKKNLFQALYPELPYTVAWHSKQEKTQKRRWPKRKIRQ